MRPPFEGAPPPPLSHFVGVEEHVAGHASQGCAPLDAATHGMSCGMMV